MHVAGFAPIYVPAVLPPLKAVLDRLSKARVAEATGAAQSDNLSTAAPELPTQSEPIILLSPLITVPWARQLFMANKSTIIALAKTLSQCIIEQAPQ